jgi:hypothetical protein
MEVGGAGLLLCSRFRFKDLLPLEVQTRENVLICYLHDYFHPLAQHTSASFILAKDFRTLELVQDIHLDATSAAGSTHTARLLLHVILLNMTHKRIDEYSDRRAQYYPNQH